jgi:hypothetical protein
MDVWCGLYRLAPDADLDAYVRWNEKLVAEVRELIPSLRRNWQIYAIEDAIGDAPKGSWTVIETIELDDWREWMPSWEGNPRLQEIWAEFGQWIDTESLQVIYGRKVYGTDF